MKHTKIALALAAIGAAGFAAARRRRRRSSSSP